MRRFMLLLGIGCLAACAMEPGTDEQREPKVAEDVAESFAYTPMGFARVAVNPNGVPSLLVKFNSSLGGTGMVTVTGGTGNYSVTFNGLGGTSAPGDRGNVQVTAEGTSNVRCRALSWGGSPDVTVSLQCNLPDGTPLGTPFAVGFYRLTTPAMPTGFPASTAYAWVTASGMAPWDWNYNGSGVLNTVATAPPGKYAVTIPNAANVNASMMVTPYGGVIAGNVCSIGSWGRSGADMVANIECRDRVGVLIDSAFSLSYSTTGPAPSQQGGHAWFDGTSANPTYSTALGKIEGCSPASVSGSRVGSLATIVVSGDLGPWDATPFVRASFTSSYGPAGYCKVESLTAAGAPPTTTATTTVRCYSATGAVVAVPRFTSTHETSDASGPC
jgi:hypothetical protein